MQMQVMPFHTSSYLLASLLFLWKLANAQANSAFNPLMNPGCSTVESIVESCAPKIGTQATISSVAFSCLCYDNSGNYAPTIYGDAASTCTDFILSAYSTTGNAFVAYAAGFCTDPSFVPVKSIPPFTTPTPTSNGATRSPSPPAGPTSSTPVTVLPGGNISSSSSSPTSSVSTTSVASPAITKGSSSSSSGTGTDSGTGSGSAAEGSASSTVSKAEGTNMVAAVRDASIWSLLGSLLAAVFVL